MWTGMVHGEERWGSNCMTLVFVPGSYSKSEYPVKWSSRILTPLCMSLCWRLWKSARRQWLDNAVVDCLWHTLLFFLFLGTVGHSLGTRLWFCFKNCQLSPRHWYTQCDLLGLTRFSSWAASPSSLSVLWDAARDLLWVGWGTGLNFASRIIGYYQGINVPYDWPGSMEFSSSSLVSLSAKWGVAGCSLWVDQGLDFNFTSRTINYCSIDILYDWPDSIRFSSSSSFSVSWVFKWVAAECLLFKAGDRAGNRAVRLNLSGNDFNLHEVWPELCSLPVGNNEASQPKEVIT